MSLGQLEDAPWLNMYVGGLVANNISSLGEFNVVSSDIDHLTVGLSTELNNSIVMRPSQLSIIGESMAQYDHDGEILYQLPDTSGSLNQVMALGANNQMYWATVSGGGGGGIDSITTGNNNLIINPILNGYNIDVNSDLNVHTITASGIISDTALYAKNITASGYVFFQELSVSGPSGIYTNLLNVEQVNAVNVSATSMLAGTHLSALDISCNNNLQVSQNTKLNAVSINIADVSSFHLGNYTIANTLGANGYALLSDGENNAYWGAVGGGSSSVLNNTDGNISLSTTASGYTVNLANNVGISNLLTTSGLIVNNNSNFIKLLTASGLHINNNIYAGNQVSTSDLLCNTIESSVKATFTDVSCSQDLQVNGHSQLTTANISTLTNNTITNYNSITSTGVITASGLVSNNNLTIGSYTIPNTLGPTGYALLSNGSNSYWGSIATAETVLTNTDNNINLTAISGGYNIDFSKNVTVSNILTASGVIVNNRITTYDAQINNTLDTYYIIANDIGSRSLTDPNSTSYRLPQYAGTVPSNYIIVSNGSGYTNFQKPSSSFISTDGTISIGDGALNVANLNVDASNLTNLFGSSGGSVTITYSGGLVNLNTISSGTWSPSLNFGGADTGIAYDVSYGYYSLQGTTAGNSIFTFTIYIKLTNMGTATGTATISLPFSITPRGFTNFLIYSENMPTGNNHFANAYSGTSTSAFQLIHTTNNGSYSLVNQTDFNNNSALSFSGSVLI